MISRGALNERVQEWGIREDVVEKDYVIGWVLWGIASDPRFGVSWAFKGGTCLRKCYMETFRFSEDLDFTVLPGGPGEPEEIKVILREVLTRIHDESGIDFSGREPLIQARPDGNSVEVRIYYRGPRTTPDVASVKFDLTITESLVRPTVLKEISHQYPDEPPSPNVVRCYGFEELFAEKIRAMGERCRPRDLYDIVSIFRRRDFLPHGELVRSILIEKCRSKGVEVPTMASLEASEYRTEIEVEWANMLGHQLPALPPFEQFWQELPSLFDWLEGKALPEELPAIPITDKEETEWKPPSTVWVWGTGMPLETIRFAGANHLCVELGYQGSTRLIEPYSLRRTSEGNLLLHAIKVDTQEHRSYGVDRIESVKVTNVPFKPKYAVEFLASGPLSTPPASSGNLLGSKGKTKRGGVVYIIGCAYCGKQFRRSRFDTHLRQHKMKDGVLNCPGRVGYLVDQSYIW